MATVLARVTRNWWTFILRGVLAMLVGIVAWIWPGVTALVLLSAGTA